MQPVKVYDPRVRVLPDTEKAHVITYGGLRVTQQVYPADSFDDTQAISNINPPSTQTITDRCVLVQAEVKFTFDQPVQIGTNDAPRAYPLASVTNVLTVQINGESISDNISQKLAASLTLGNTNQDRIKSASQTPAMPDQYQNYSDWTIFGSARNPLASYGENSSEMSRGGFPPELVAIDNKSATYVFTEPLLLSPFCSGYGSPDEGFVNVNQFNFTFRWDNNLARMWSHSTAGNPITAITATFSKVSMIMTYITPDLTEPIPTRQILPYTKPVQYIKDQVQLIPGETATYQSDTIKLSQVPYKLLLFCKRSTGTSSFSTSDSFLNISQMNVSWNNQTGLLSSASERQLWDISVRNGSNLSWPQWHLYRGSVFCLEFGKDIGLLDTEAPGVQGQFNLQVQIFVKNVSGGNFTPQFYMVPIYTGTFAIQENSASASLGNLTPQIVLASKSAYEVEKGDHVQMEGGGFLTKLKNIINKTSRFVQMGAQAAKYIPALAPYASAAEEVAGFARKHTGGAFAGGRMTRAIR